MDSKVMQTRVFERLMVLLVLVCFPTLAAFASGMKTFSGRILNDYTGDPVDAATVDLMLFDLFGPILLDRVVTGSDGAFTVSSDRDGALSIRILREGYSENSTFSLGNLDSPTTVTGLEYHIVPLGRLVVHLTAGDGGADIEGADVDYGSGYATTDATGVAAFENVLPGDKLVCAFPVDEYEAVCAGNYPLGWSTSLIGQFVTVNPGETTQVELVAPLGGAVEGTVRSSGSGDMWGHGGYVSARSYNESGGDRQITVLLQPDGSYRLSGLPPGDVRVFARTSSSGPYWFQDQLFDELPCLPTSCATATATAVAASAGSTVIGVDFSVIAPAGLGGHVTDASSGLPLQGVEVTLYTRPFMSWETLRTTTTDINGDYLFDFLAKGLPFRVGIEQQGTYAAQVWPARPCYTEHCGEAGDNIVLNLNETRPDRDFALVGGASISGHVDVLGEPAATPATVQLYDDTDERVWFAAVDENGNYETQLLPAGSYRLAAYVTPSSQQFCGGYIDYTCPTTGYAPELNLLTPVVTNGIDNVTGIDMHVRRVPLFKGGFESSL